MPTAVDYVLFAVKKASSELANTDSRIRLLEVMANNPGSSASIGWAAARFSQNSDDFHFDLLLSPNKFGDGTNIPSGSGLPYWLFDEKVRQIVPVVALSTGYILSTKMAVAQANWLDDQSKLELLTALEGRKVSRLTLELKEAFRLQQQLGIPIACAPYIISYEHDEKLPHFSNTMVKINTPAETLSARDTVNVFIAKDWRDAMIACSLDEQNLAGQLLGIPECCRSWFAKTWDKSVEYAEGDLAYMSMQEHVGKATVLIPWQCNAYGVYFGASFLSHFPCKSFCHPTISLVDDLACWLQAVDPSLYVRIQTVQKSPFWFCNDRRTSRIQPRSGVGWTFVQPY